MVAQAERLPGNSGELVKDYGIRQILLRRKDLYLSTPGELADEVIFLRDNRPGPVVSGSLVPLIPEEELAEEERNRLCRVIAVLRLVLGNGFLPLPGVLWKNGELCGGNFLIRRAGIELDPAAGFF